MFNRPTSLADAFITAACKTKCNPDKGTGHWVARRSIINAARPGFAVVREYDKSPKKAKKALAPAEYRGLVDGLEQVFLAAALTDVPY